MDDEKRPIFYHLEELRKRILFSLVCISFLSALSYFFAEDILRYLAKYVHALIFISPEEAFLSYLKISIFAGLVLSSPIVIFNALRFIWVGLKKDEGRTFFVFLFFGIFLFASGAAFAFYVVLPVAIRFLLSFSSDFLRPYLSVSRYVSFSGFLVLAFSLSFETPLFIACLARLGLVNSLTLRKKRRYMIVALFVVAALLTPPDVITQILLAAPLLVLYEISIIVAGVFEKK